MDENTRELLCFDKKNRKTKDYYVTYHKYLDGKTEQLSDEESNIFSADLPEIDTEKSTLREICKGLGIEVPQRYIDIADEPQILQFRPEYVTPGDIYLVLRSAEELEMKRTTTKQLYDQAIEKGAKLVIMSRQDFDKFEVDEEACPVILTDHINERILRFFHILRKQHQEKVVMITGSVGKTTTKQLCDVVTENRFHTFVNGGNTNSVHKVAHHLYHKMDSENEVYIQEAGAGYVGSVTFAGAMLRPDIFILTNVYKHHMENYKTLENVFADKTGPDEFMAKDGIIITNYDDENIRNYEFEHEVKSFAIDYKDADYRAINIEQSIEGLKVEVLETATGNTAQLEVKLQGEHNVYNVLAAYVMAKTLGLTDDEIKEEFLRYETKGIRQNFTNIGGTYFNIDCYNVAEESILAMLKTGEKLQLKDGGKRYAIIGGENKLGEEVSERSLEFGRKLAGIHVDKYLFCGVKSRKAAALNKYGDALSIREGFKQVSEVSARYSKDIESIVKFLKKNVRRNDLVMLKGIYHLDMTIAVDKVFGTSFSFGLPHYKKTTTEIAADGYKASLIDQLGELELAEAPVTDGELVIPEEMEGYPVFRIANEAFEKKESLKKIRFGKSVKNIGKKSFEECTSLKTLVIPDNIKVIEKEAFKGCTGLEKVILNKGVVHIDDYVFANCEKLKEIRIPETVGMIADHAFDGCANLKIICDKNSEAYLFAKKHHIPVKTLTWDYMRKYIHKVGRKIKKSMKSGKKKSGV